MTILTLWRAVASDFVNFVDFVNLVRSRICFKFSLLEKGISHNVHEVRKVHQEDRFTDFHPFSVRSLANRSRKLTAGWFGIVPPVCFIEILLSIAWALITMKYCREGRYPCP